MDRISSNRIIKIGIVTADAEATAKALTDMFEPAAPYDSHEPPQVPYSKERYQLYRGEPASGIQMKVRLVYLEPVYFEIVQPIGDASSPWHDHFKKYGTSVCSGRPEAEIQAKAEAEAKAKAEAEAKAKAIAEAKAKAAAAAKAKAEAAAMEKTPVPTAENMKEEV